MCEWYSVNFGVVFYVFILGILMICYYFKLKIAVNYIVVLVALYNKPVMKICCESIIK